MVEFLFHTQINEDGDVRCSECGAINSDDQESFLGYVMCTECGECDLVSNY